MVGTRALRWGRGTPGWLPVLLSAAAVLLGACVRDTLDVDPRAVPSALLSDVSGYVLVSRLDSMGPQDVTFGRTIACPAGKQILGGGAQNGTPGVVFRETYPKPAGNAWTYAVSRETGGTTVAFTGWAVCADSGIAGYSMVSRVDSMAPSAVTFARDLTCSFGKRVLGGGVENATYGVMVQATHPKSPGTTWGYAVSRDAGGTTVTFTGRAACADSTLSGYALVSRLDSMVGQATSFGRSLPCPSGKHVLSGGVQNATYGVVVRENYPNSSGDTWSYTVARDSGSTTVKFTGWAVCATVT